jgi:hypothetical protein
MNANHELKKTNCGLAGSPLSRKGDSRREATGGFSLCGKYVIAGKFYKENLPAAYAAVPLLRKGAFTAKLQFIIIFKS